MNLGIKYVPLTNISASEQWYLRIYLNFKKRNLQNTSQMFFSKAAVGLGTCWELVYYAKNTQTDGIFLVGVTVG